MKKEELLNLEREELVEIILNLQEQLLTKKGGRKDEVLKIIQEMGPIHIKDIAKQIGITNKNVSSQLTYLKSDNIDICTDSKGRKFIPEN